MNQCPVCLKEAFRKPSAEEIRRRLQAGSEQDELPSIVCDNCKLMLTVSQLQSEEKIKHASWKHVENLLRELLASAKQTQMLIELLSKPPESLVEELTFIFPRDDRKILRTALSLPHAVNSAATQ